MTLPTGKFFTIAIKGVKVETAHCKELLSRLNDDHFPSGVASDQWKRLSKYGRSPMVYRIFEHKEGIYAKVVETPYQLAVVAIEPTAELAKNAPVPGEVEVFLCKPLVSNVTGATPVQAPICKPFLGHSKDDDELGWSREFIQHVRNFSGAQQQQVHASSWRTMLDIEDSITEAEILAFRHQFEQEWRAATRTSISQSGTYAFCDMLEKYDLMDSDDVSHMKDRDYLLRRKAVAGLFTLRNLCDSNGEEDSEDNEFDNDDLIAGWFIDRTGQIESDEPHWLERVFSSSMDDINESAEICLLGDPSVNDLDAIVSQRTKLYVWALERGFDVPNPPAEARSLVAERQRLRAQERGASITPSGVSP